MAQPRADLPSTFKPWLDLHVTRKQVALPLNLPSLQGSSENAFLEELGAVLAEQKMHL